jgi:hypothetical protein
MLQNAPTAEKPGEAVIRDAFFRLASDGWQGGQSADEPASALCGTDIAETLSD